MAMFEGVPQQTDRQWSGSFIVSFAVHIALVLVVLYRAAPLFLTPSDVGLGIPHSSGSVSIVYLAPVGPEQALHSPEKPRLIMQAALPKKPKPPKVEAKPRELPSATAENAPEQTARGGSFFGHVPGSPLTGDEVVPALPEVFPDPPVTRDDLPVGVQGDVIVEVTIDPQGNVVETKLLQGMGYGVEQKVLAVLQRWHFRPAMRDGMTIASQHIVHFHYPS
ncbi:MAG: energy transducer TonB [Candidatus Korobacteraceae bacterium]